MKEVILVLSLILGAGCSTLSSNPSDSTPQGPLTLQPPTPLTEFGETEIIAGAKIVKVEINGQIARMVIDENSDSSAITPELKVRLDLGLLRVAEATLADHRRVWLDVVKLEDMKIASRILTLSPVLVFDVNQNSPVYGAVDGILGQDFLRVFSSTQAQLQNADNSSPRP